MPSGPNRRPPQWEPGVPDVSDAGTESPDEGASPPPPPPGSGMAGRTLPPRVSATPGFTLPPHVAQQAEPAPVTSPATATAPRPSTGRSPVMWALLALLIGALAFALAFGVSTAILLSSR